MTPVTCFSGAGQGAPYKALFERKGKRGRKSSSRSSSNSRRSSSTTKQHQAAPSSTREQQKHQAAGASSYQTLLNILMLCYADAWPQSPHTPIYWKMPETGKKCDIFCEGFKTPPAELSAQVDTTSSMFHLRTTQTRK